MLAAKNTPQEVATTKEKRLNEWQERQKKIARDFSHEVEDMGYHAHQAIASFKDESVTAKERDDVYKATISAATGSASYEYGNMLFCQTLGGFFMPSENNEKTTTANAIFDSLLSMKPQDEYEGMLCSRLLVLHNQYMHFMARISFEGQVSNVIDANLNRATKLMRLYNETLEVLNKYRRKGEQKVIVQHVNVNDGGQAIVAGEVSQGGGNNKK